MRGIGHVSEWQMWLVLIGAAGAILFPHLVVADGLFADSFIDARTVRIIAIPLFVVMAVLLTDYHFHWSRGWL